MNIDEPGDEFSAKDRRWEEKAGGNSDYDILRPFAPPLTLPPSVLMVCFRTSGASCGLDLARGGFFAIFGCVRDESGSWTWRKQPSYEPTLILVRSQTRSGESRKSCGL